MPDESPAKPVKFRPEAMSEALEAFDWYEQHDPNVADRFDGQLRETTARISSRPHVHPRYPGQPAAQFTRLKGFPYLVIYRELVETIEVIAVAHARRRPMYWDSRVTPDDE